MFIIRRVWRYPRGKKIP